MSLKTSKKKNCYLLENYLKLEDALVLAKKKEKEKKSNFKPVSNFISEQENSLNSLMIISDAIVSFQSLSKMDYSSHKNTKSIDIPFDELDSEFKNILINEFEDAIQNL